MPRNLSQHLVHLGLGASAVVEPAFSGMDWYQDYSTRHADDGREGRLVSMHAFDGPWDSWEMHPEGSELVVCTGGEMTLVQEIEGQEVRTRLRRGEYAINDAGLMAHRRCAGACDCPLRYRSDGHSDSSTVGGFF